MRIIRRHRLATALAVCALATASMPCAMPQAADHGPGRPALEVHQGRYFRWAAPAGWRSSETTNGVDVTAPDGSATAGFALLMRSRGYVTPIDFMLGMLGRVPGYANLRVVAKHALPDQPSGIPGTAWKVAEAELSFTVKGRPVRAIYTCGINAYYGMYDAVLRGYYASVLEWPRAQLFLPEIARSVSITNPREVAGNDQLIPAKNRPLDNSGLMESWRQKGLSQDRISKARREGTMGYERVKDPETGRIYEMPLEAYDGTVGGYRNPKRPGEILQKTQPGE
jgi:hypothetical protein